MGKSTDVSDTLALCCAKCGDVEMWDRETAYMFEGSWCVSCLSAVDIEIRSRDKRVINTSADYDEFFNQKDLKCPICLEDEHVNPSVAELLIDSLCDKCLEVVTKRLSVRCR